MTLDELMQIFDKAYCLNLERYASKISSERAGIRAVVEALRDELRREWFLDDSGLESVERWMNEILASNGVDKAHVSDGDVGPSLHQTPAAAPTVGQRLIKAAKEAAAIAKGEAPAAAPVCEWTPKGIFHGARVHVAACDGGVRATYGFTHCPTCKRPISFKDAAR